MRDDSLSRVPTNPLFPAGRLVQTKKKKMKVRDAYVTEKVSYRGVQRRGISDDVQSGF